jgi:hypothetical protein
MLYKCLVTQFSYKFIENNVCVSSQSLRGRKRQILSYYFKGKSQALTIKSLFDKSNIKLVFKNILRTGSKSLVRAITIPHRDSAISYQS